MECRYVRIQGRDDSWVTKYPKGIFSLCWRLIMDGRMLPEDEKTFREIDAWFRENLPEPAQCKNGEKVITFFKTGTTAEMLERLRPAVRILDRYAVPWDIVRTNSVGTVVYEDEWQVAVKVDGGKMV